MPRGRKLRDVAVAALLFAGSVSPAAAAIPERSSTPAGLRLWEFPTRGDDFTLVVLVDAGSRDEEPGKTGLAHVVEHAIFRGARDVGAAATLGSLAEHTSGWNGWTTHDFTAYWFHAPVGDAEALVDLASAMLVRPAFTADDVRKETTIVLEELAAGPTDVAPTTIASLLYPGHPLGRGVGGEPRDVAALTAADVRGFWESHYRQGRTIVAWAGRPGDDSLRTRIASAFSGLPGGGASHRREPPRAATGVILTPGASMHGGSVWMGHHLPHRTAENLAALLVFARLYEHRLFHALRTDEALAYRFGVSVATHADAWRLDTSVKVTDTSRLSRIVAAAGEALGRARRPEGTELLRTVEQALTDFSVAGGVKLLEATERTALLDAAAGRPVDVEALLRSVTGARLAAFADSEIGPATRFVISDNSSLSAVPWRLLAGLAAAGAAALIWRGRHAVRRRWRDVRLRRRLARGLDAHTLLQFDREMARFTGRRRADDDKDEDGGRAG